MLPSGPRSTLAVTSYTASVFVFGVSTTWADSYSPAPPLSLLFHGESLEARERQENTVYVIDLSARPAAAYEPSLDPNAKRFRYLSRGGEAVMGGLRSSLQPVAETLEQSFDIITRGRNRRAIGNNPLEPDPEFFEFHLSARS